MPARLERRHGGEEFLLIPTGSTAEAAREAAERIRAAVESRHWNSAAPGLGVTFSAGVTAFRKGDTIEQFLKRADKALCQAKRTSRNRAVTLND